MLGPKQFDIGHKVKPRRDLGNPIVNKIFEPKFKYREDELKTLIESFVDKFKSPLLEMKEIKSSPIVKSINFQPEKNENEFKNTTGSFLDKFNLPKTYEPKNNKHKVPVEKDEEYNELSDDMINKITYKVFQNIKEYLNNDMMSSGRKHIKLEINL